MFLIYIQYRSVRTAWKKYLFGEDNGSSISSFDSVQFPICDGIAGCVFSIRRRWLEFRGRSDFSDVGRFPLVPSSINDTPSESNSRSTIQTPF
jgi:hypothetical protein